MNTISINLNVPKDWHELDDPQLRYVYSLIAKEFAADEIKTTRSLICRVEATKICLRQLFFKS